MPKAGEPFPSDRPLSTRAPGVSLRLINSRITDEDRRWRERRRRIEAIEERRRVEREREGDW